MTNWKYRLELADEWRMARGGDLSPHELAGIVAGKLGNLPCFNTDQELHDIAEDFLLLDKGATFDEFDDVMVALYDWADTTLPPHNAWPRNKQCWIATF